jgi:hypothetical protein
MRQRLTMDLPEPPALNRMLDIAKKRTRRTKGGGWRNEALPTVYDQEKHEYGELCTVVSRQDGIFPPREPWLKWRLVEARFRLWGPRDPIELLAGLKWPVDWLVDSGFVIDDSARNLVGIPLPDQVVDRRNRGITITIERADHGV